MWFTPPIAIILIRSIRIWRKEGFLSGFYYGVLDHLTVITKYALNLEINERYCGILSKDYRKLIEKKVPELHIFLERQDIKEWIKLMSDIRHPSAHRSIPIPTAILRNTEVSQWPREKIIENLKETDSELLYRQRAGIHD